MLTMLQPAKGEGAWEKGRLIRSHCFVFVLLLSCQHNQTEIKVSHTCERRCPCYLWSTHLESKVSELQTRRGWGLSCMRDANKRVEGQSIFGKTINQLWMMKWSRKESQYLGSSPKFTNISCSVPPSFLWNFVKQMTSNEKVKDICR